jgi:hypothetical protein
MKYNASLQSVAYLQPASVVVLEPRQMSDARLLVAFRNPT